jgi:hypothetical protein
MLIEGGKQENLRDHWLVFVYVLANKATCEISSHVDPTLSLRTKGQHTDWFSQAGLIHGYVLWSSGASKINRPDALFMTAPRAPPFRIASTIKRQAWLRGITLRVCGSLHARTGDPGRRKRRSLKQSTIRYMVSSHGTFPHVATSSAQHRQGVRDGALISGIFSDESAPVVATPDQPGGRIDAQKRVECSWKWADVSYPESTGRVAIKRRPIRIMMGRVFGKRARSGCEAVESVAQGTAP